MSGWLKAKSGRIVAKCSKRLIQGQNLKMLDAKHIKELPIATKDWSNAKRSQTLKAKIAKVYIEAKSIIWLTKAKSG